MVASNILKERMSKEGITQGYLADKLKIAQSSLALKINNYRSFTIEEMFKISDILDLDLLSLRQIFLSETCEMQDKKRGEKR